MGGLPEERKWGAALGHVDGALTIAAGIDYGDDTIDVYDGSQWSREKQRMMPDLGDTRFGYAKCDSNIQCAASCQSYFGEAFDLFHWPLG